MLWCQIAPFGLANWTKMVLPVFPRNISYRARPKSPPFHFFRHCETVFSKFFSSKGSSFQFFSALWDFFPKIKIFLSIFSCFATEWMLKNLRGSPLSVFRHCETLARHSVHLFSMNFFQKKFRFSTTVNEYLTLGSLFAIFEPWIWRRLGPVLACFAFL